MLLFIYWVVICAITMAAFIYEEKDGPWVAIGWFFIGLFLGWIIIPVGILMRLSTDK